MADGYGKRVGRVIRRRNLLKFEKKLNHGLDLRFIRTAVSDHGAFDLERRVFTDGKTFLRRNQKRDPPCVAQLQGGLDVGGVKNILDRHDIHAFPRKDTAEFVIDLQKALVERLAGGGLYDAVRKRPVSRTIRFYDTVTGRAAPRIHAQYPNHR